MQQINQAIRSDVEPRDDRSRSHEAPVSLRRWLVALDASDQANHALDQAVRLAASAGGQITGIHAYAAKLHDKRFRQMESGLPERYREENELEHQRVVHDELIGRGLRIISDSYHEHAQAACDANDVTYQTLSPEGKNYRRLVEAAETGEFDVMAMGSVGLGTVPGNSIGTVCERVTRRCPIDLLVVRDAERAIGDGPIVAAIDGSPRAYGVLKTALDLGRRLGCEVHAVAAYDPYFHYVAFNKIAGVLSDEAGKTFRFKEQEQLHEELIDDGIAKIYQSHLEVAKTIAEGDGMALTSQLLDGKPHVAIGKYLRKVGASLVLAGKTGIHADPELDIGGTAENLIRAAPCHVWLGQVTYTPPFDTIARETITWSQEAEARMGHVPETAQNMVRMTLMRMAQEKGHTVITSSLIDEAMRRFCPDAGGRAPESESLDWTADAEALLARHADSAEAATIRLRAEKKARHDGAASVEAAHVEGFLADAEAGAPAWTAAARARLARVPEMVRPALRRRTEDLARESALQEITDQLVERAIIDSRAAMADQMALGGHPQGRNDGG